ncbi:MAG: RsmD family RNA methyltransferase [Crocinitomicaceae bacterium]|nr:RsmD family RNA methyltransferase [Crocinitomicaceae bacterium]
MRIIRGKFKTRYFRIPKSFPSRPTTDFAKEGLFNIIEHNYSLENLRILDLCAGSGNISFEFLSREAGTVIAVDKNFNCYKHMKMMSHKYECADDLTVIKSDLVKFLKRTEEKFDLIFADPPYTYEAHEEIADLVFERELLTDDGILIIEHGKRTSLKNITHFDFERMYGGVHFSFFQINDNDA